MANYSVLKQAIQDVVKTNGNNEITGALLQQTLFAMVNSLGGYYQFAGIATPTTNPGTPDQNVFYIASSAGTYTNFGGLVLADGEIAMLKYNGAWSKDLTGSASLETVNQMIQEINAFLGERVDIVSDLSITNGKFINVVGSLFDLSSAKYGIIELLAGDILDVRVKGNEGVSLISKTNETGTVFNNLVSGKGNTQQTQITNVIFIVPENGYYAICTTDNTVFDCYKRVGSALSNVGAKYQAQIDVINNKINEILQKNESTLQLTTESGYYISSGGNKSPFSTAIISTPVYLNIGDVLAVTAYGNAAVSFISQTDASGSSYEPKVIGTGPTSGGTIQTVTYTVEESGYYAFCSLGSTLSVILTDITGGIIKTLIDEINTIQSSIEELEQQQRVKYSISMFEKIACCGDSYVIAQIYNSGGLVGDRPNLSWGKNIGRIEGIEANIYASSGADTNTWQTRSACLPAALAAEPSGLYIFCLGINDTTYVTKGSMSDITNYDDYQDYPNTFYGNYGKIIEQIKAHAPNSKIIIMTPCHPAYVANWLTPITEITEYYGIAMINTLESDFINSTEYTSRLMGGHPTAALQGALAVEIIKLVSRCINNNYDYFKDYIGV